MLPVEKGEPVWNLALMFPRQGNWTEEAYLALNTNRPIELSDGCLEFLPMPLPFHQFITQYLFKLLDAWVTAHQLGSAFTSPLRIRLWDSKIRLPDVVFLRPERLRDLHRTPTGADLAIEVVSEGEENRERDYETKHMEYARAGISEYWIVDPELEQITLFVLEGTTYREHAVFKPGQQAASVLLPGFLVDVAATFAAGQGPAAGSA
jgi:Uma2 family endonuclease